MSNDIDIPLLISLVKERPVLWNKNDKDHRDKEKIGSAWEDVCVALKSDFRRRSNEERKKYCEVVKTKWKSIKNYYRTLKKDSDSTKLKKYKYSEYLGFLDSLPDTTEHTRGDDTGTASARSSGRNSDLASDISNINDEMERMTLNNVGHLQAFIASIQSQFDDFDECDMNELKGDIFKSIGNIKRKKRG